MAIVTPADAKAQLNILSADTSQDTELTAFIAAATEVVEHITGPVEARQVVEVHDGGQGAIVLREPPVLSVTSVTEGGVTVPSTGYVLSSAGVLYRTPGAWSTGWNAVTVTYQAGRSTVPPSIRQAVLELVAVNFRSQQGGNYSPFDSGADAGDQGGQPRLGFFVPNRVMQLLDPHRQGGGFA